MGSGISSVVFTLSGSHIYGRQSIDAPKAPTRPPTRRSLPSTTPEPAPKLANDTSSPNLDRNQPSIANPFINPEKLNWVPDATDLVFDAVLDKVNSLRLPFSLDRRFSGRRR